MAVASALPQARAILDVGAGEDAAVEAEDIAFVDDEVVEVRLQRARRPALFDGPSGRSMRSGETIGSIRAVSRLA
jgi:hypothetical protein